MRSDVILLYSWFSLLWTHTYGAGTIPIFPLTAPWPDPDTTPISVTTRNPEAIASTTTDENGYAINVTYPYGNLTESWLVGREELNYLLGIHSIKTRYNQLIQQSIGDEWSEWSACPVCTGNQTTPLFQLRVHRNTTLSYEAGEYDSNNWKVEARVCDQNPGLCPDTYEYVYRGCWVYDWSAGLNMTHLHVSASESGIATVAECIYLATKTTHMYIVLWNSGCYGTNSSAILLRGRESNKHCSVNRIGTSQTIDIFIIPDCPDWCELLGQTGVCLCMELRSGLEIDDGNYCNYRGPTVSKGLLEPYLQIHRWQAGIALYVSAEVFPEPGNITCGVYDGSGSITLDSSACADRSQNYAVPCIYNDTRQYSWSSWSSWSSCSLACDGGITTQRRYRLVPTTNGTETRAASCNNEICPWNANLALYPKWAGCWRQLGSVFTAVTDPILDYQLVGYKQPHLKCAIVAHDRQTSHFALRENFCYLANITDASEYINIEGAGYKCFHKGYQTGRHWDVYTFHEGPLTPQYGAWSDFDSCSQACVKDGISGTRNRTRLCDNPPPLHVAPTSTSCNGSRYMDYTTQPCNQHSCPEPFDITLRACKQAPSDYPLPIVIGHDLLDFSSNISTLQAPVDKCGLIAYSFNETVFAMTRGGYCVIDFGCWHSGLNDTDICVNGLGAHDALSLYKIGQGPLCPPQTTLPPRTAPPIDIFEEVEKPTSLVPQQLESYLRGVQNIQQNLTADAASNTTKFIQLLSENLILNSTANATEVMYYASEIVGAVLKEENRKVWGQSGGQVESVMTSIETLVKRAVEIIPDNTAEPRIIRTNNLDIIANSVNSDTTKQMGLEIPKSQLGNGVSLRIPPEAFSNTQEEDIQLVVISYKRLGDFVGTPNVEDNLKSGYGSDVGLKLANNVVSLDVSVRQDRRLTEPLTLEIPVSQNERSKIQETTNKTVDLELYCTFWNTSSLLWSTQGCMTIVENDSVKCECDHMTSFAVLMRVTEYAPSGANAAALRIIGYVGSGLSVFCLAFCFTAFLYLDNLKTERKKIHMNLCVAMGLAQLTHAIGIELTTDSTTCKCIAIMLHFFYTATFAWMLCEGVHLYHKIIAVFDSEGRSKQIMYYCIGWGAPLVVVGVSVGIRFDGYGTQDFCWLSTTDGLIWAFVGPVIGVIVVNFIIMAIVIRIVVISATSNTPEEKKKIEVVKSGVKSVVILTPILGTNWLFGLLAVNEKMLVFEFLFVIINSLQGLLIFLFHCVGSSEVRAAFTRKREQISRSKSLDNSLSDNNKKRKKSNWFSDAKVSNWSSAKTKSSADQQRSIISGLMEGTMGRNLGGLKHMASPEGYNDQSNNNGMLEREDTVSPTLSFQTRWGNSASRKSNGQTTKFSTSTVTTSLADSDSSSRRSSTQSNKSVKRTSNSLLEQAKQKELSRANTNITSGRFREMDTKLEDLEVDYKV